MLSSEDEDEAAVEDPKINLEDIDTKCGFGDQQTTSEKKKKRRTTKQLYKDKLNSEGKKKSKSDSSESKDESLETQS